MSGQQVEVAINQIEKQRLGYQAISLTNFDNDSEPQVCAGSTIEIAGALFEFTSNESITGWGAIGNNNDVYIKCVVAGTSVTAEFTTAPPTWSTSKQGWYDSLDRYIGGCYKDGSGNYTKKYLFDPTGRLIRRENIDNDYIFSLRNEGSTVIPALGTWTPTFGIWNVIEGSGGGTCKVEIYVNSAWRPQCIYMSGNWLLVSNGANVRLKENIGSPVTIWYHRIF